MAFKIGAALGGFATTLAERVAEEEKRVDLLTNRALDLHTQLKLERDKENATNLKNAENLINALGITGLDLETRAAIAQGGEVSVKHALNQFDAATAKGVDFKTVYNVANVTPGTEEFTANDWASQIVKPLPEPEIATGVLGESQTVFGPDPQAVLKRKIAVSTPDEINNAVSQVFKPAELNIDMSQLSDKADQYTSIEAALVGTTYLLRQEEAKGDDANADTIARLEGDLIAYSMLEKDGGKKSMADRIDALGVTIAEYDAMPEENRPDDWQIKRDAAQSTMDSFIRVSNSIKSKQDLSAEKFSSHNALLVSIDNQLLYAKGKDKDNLLQQRKTIFDQMLADKKALAEAEGGDAGDYTVFSSQSVDSILNNALKRSLEPQGFEFGLQGQLLTKLKGNEAAYIVGSYAAIDEVETTYKDVSDNVLSNALQAQKNRIDNTLTSYKNNKFSTYLSNQQLQPAKETEGFYIEPDVGTAVKNAENGKYKVGDIIRTENPAGDTVMRMWTGTNFI